MKSKSYMIQCTIKGCERVFTKTGRPTKYFSVHDRTIYGCPFCKGYDKSIPPNFKTSYYLNDKGEPEFEPGYKNVIPGSMAKPNYASKNPYRH